MTNYSFSRLDASNESANTGMKVEDLAADGLNWPSLLAGLATVQSAIDGVCDGSAFQEGVTAFFDKLTNIVPTDDSRRETKWLVTYEDDVTFALHWFTFPCSDWTNCARAGTTDFWDLENGTPQQDALVLAVENHAKSALGNNVTVISVEDVGRNN